MTISSSRTALLTELLLELVEILRDRQGDTWAAIVRVATGKSAVVAIDEVRLYIQTQGEQDHLQLVISDPDADAENAFESKGITLRNIMFGKTSLDKAVASGKIMLRASFGDLLKIRNVVSAVLADTEIDPRLAKLWQRFDQEWELGSSS